PGMLDLWLDVAPGADAILSIPGHVNGINNEPLLAYLVFGAAADVASVVVVSTGDTASTVSTSELTLAFPGATFTPIYLEYGNMPNPALATGNPMTIPANGFPLYLTFMLAGNYAFTTSVVDIWGNEGTSFDTITLLEPLG